MAHRWSLVPILAILTVLLVPSPLQAQARNEIAFSAGGGALLSGESDHFSPVFSLSYLFHFNHHLAAKGALDFFVFTFPIGPLNARSEHADDYGGAEAALVYYLRESGQAGKWIPFVAAGAGKTTTDFAEVPGTPYFRFGGGVSYNVSERFGARMEFRDEFIEDIQGVVRSDAHLPSLRVALFYRFYTERQK